MSEREEEKDIELSTLAASNGEKPAENGPAASGTVGAAFQASLAEWILVFSLVFGGCCSSIFTLEAIVKKVPSAGNLITFVQFVFVAVEGYIYFFDRNGFLFIRKPKVPIKRWMVNVTLFFITSVLNNCVFAFHISVPLHIIFRSSGAVTTMLVGVFVGKKFTVRQVFAAFLLTVGVVMATIASSKTEAERPAADPEKGGFSADFLYFLGIGILFLSAVLTSIMALYVEQTYRIYGKHWKENLFYMHFLSLPMFLLIGPAIWSEFWEVWNDEPKLTLAILGVPIISWSKSFFNLVLNAFTQYACVRGVNNLAGNTSALTLMIVLNVRKFVSLLLSIYFFGNPISMGIIVGTVLVFTGVFLYSNIGVKK